MLEQALKDQDINYAVLPDHPVPIKMRVHTTCPVPLAICGKDFAPDNINVYSETLAPQGKLGLLKRDQLVRKLLEI